MGRPHTLPHQDVYTWPCEFRRGERSPAFYRIRTRTAADQQQASSSTENVGSCPTVRTFLGPAGKQNKHYGSAGGEE